MARIVTVYSDTHDEFRPVDMAFIRWLKISEALSRRGHTVDMASNEKLLRGRFYRKGSAITLAANLRRVSLRDVRWDDYDVVKTLFHFGFRTLTRFGGGKHPFIISKLGSVVGPTELDGIHFHGRVRARLFKTQQQIYQTSRYVTLLTPAAESLWEACFPTKGNTLLVPGAVDAEIPHRAQDPFPKDGRIKCIYSGNVYGRAMQPEANAVLIEKLNRLGQFLSGRGARLYLLGPGDVNRLDSTFVSYLGALPHDRCWDYLYFADVGIVIAPGKYLHNNESTKIYYYLRSGLPVVSESGFPNNHIIGEAKLGFVAENGNIEDMGNKVLEAAKTPWDRSRAVDYVLAHHTWDSRVEVYDRLIMKEFNALSYEKSPVP
jgi:glycosyltransferase involved in cell wall biosynthesis